MSAIIHDVVYQHAENACALWHQRQQAVDEAHYTFDDLVHLDTRLEANLDGLRIAGIHADPMLDEMIEAGDEGARFTRGLLALERGEHSYFLTLLETVGPDEEGRDELGSALCRAEPEHLRGIARELLGSHMPAAIVLGLRTCAAHRRSPGAHLASCNRHADATVRAAASRTAAGLGERAFAALLLHAEPDDERERFERARALAMLGHAPEARRSLRSLALGTTASNGDATALLMLMSDSNAGRTFLKQLTDLPGRERDVVRGFGLIGDPVALPWLIERCREPSVARLAGEAITTITGVDIAYEDLDLDDPPDGVETTPNDDPDDDRVALDEDESLPWPDAGRLAAWWGQASGQFPNGALHLGGLVKEPAALERVLRDAYQRQRTAAACALALARPATGYLDTRLPSARQRRFVVEPEAA